MNVSLLPAKHVQISESLLGLGAIMLSLLESGPKTLETLWTDVKTSDLVKRKVNGTLTFDRVVLAIDFLYSIGAVTLNRQGRIEKCG